MTQKFTYATNKWIKLLEFYDHGQLRSDWKTLYQRYRVGRTKHQYWLDNRKNPEQALVDEYDYRILQNCQPGHTVFYSSAGYYLKDLWPEITAVEIFPVVKTFYPDVIICERREDLAQVLLRPADNLAIVNNRTDYWVTTQELTGYLKTYCQALAPGARFFYSFRDTQIYYNRLKVDAEQLFLDWAQSLEHELDLKLVWHDIDFRRKTPNELGEYDAWENPDNTNGNLKFWFVYQGEPWSVI